MIYPRRTIIETEVKKGIKQLSEEFKKYNENWHNGETYKLENNLVQDNDDEDIRYFQFKTIFKENNSFVYDEVIKRKDKPVYLLALHNDKKKEILELIIYFEKNKVVQQIRHLNYETFLNEIENNEDIIKKTETESTTIIKTPFLEFIQKINQLNLDKPKEIKVKKSFFSKVKDWWKQKSSGSKKWFLLKAAAFIGCIVISTGLGLIPTTIILGISAIKPIAVGVSILLGFVAIPWNNVRNKIVDWVFNKKQQKIEDLPEFQKLKLENEQLKQELFLSQTSSQKQERLLNAFSQILQKNKTKDFATLAVELNKKFQENKKYLAKEAFKKNYEQKIEQWNANWKEKVAFSQFLKPRHIKEIKETFKESDNNKSLICDGYFYHPKEVWEEFQVEKTLESVEQLFDNSAKNDNFKSDDEIKKSPMHEIIL